MARKNHVYLPKLRTLEWVGAAEATGLGFFPFVVVNQQS